MTSPETVASYQRGQGHTLLERLRESRPRYSVTTGEKMFEVFWNRDGEEAADLIQGLVEEGQFLIARLDEFEQELMDDEVASQFFGHVLPSLGRFRSIVALSLADAGKGEADA